MRYGLPLFTAAAALVALSLAPAEASACGGFFCDTNQPVNQAAERIIFARHDDGTVDAIIQITYAGPSERFAWMLPVHGSPEIGVSSNSAFNRLQQTTNPSYRLNTIVEGTCREQDFAFGASPSAGASDGGAPARSPDEDSGVTVVDAGNVGPYDFVVISVEEGTARPAQVAVDWLGDEGFDVNDFGVDRLEPYMQSGMNLLAFRLTKGNDAGSIRPVTIGFGAGLPSIPLRPTAVAAEDDMGVMVWVLGETRAVPSNYLSLELNEALIDWFRPNATYNDVVTQAANEAGGQGFVTEFAGDSEPLGQNIFPDFERDEWTFLQETDWSERHGDLLQRVLSQYGQHDGMRDAIASTVPLPVGVTRDELVNCPFCFLDFAQPTIEGFDVDAFMTAVDAQVIEPLASTRALFDEIPYATRMYTTMSADEMTMDPIFDFNADLGDYSNVHVADRIIECSPSIFQNEAPWRVTLDDGITVRGTGRTWPFSTGGAFPANRVTRRIGAEGEGRIIDDNTGTIQAALQTSNAEIPGPPPASGCAVSPSGTAPTGAFGLLLALGALALGRRRFGKRA